ncbi:hypothetical protein BGX21_003692 [Mortierella sp. AD011]|nr:hypothetical protein BGX21_003692 [Mortierella sp. AD011]
MLVVLDRYSFSFPRLLSIKYTPTDANPRDDGLMLRLVQSMPSLQSLTMEFSPFREANHAKLIGILESHPGLRKLDLICYVTTSSITTIQRIIQASRQLESVRLEFRSCGQVQAMDESEWKNQCNLTSEALYSMQDTRIRELSLQLLSADQQAAILPPLLERCPLLEKLDWDYWNDSETLERISSLFRGRSYLSLRHLYLRNESNQLLDERPALDLILSLGHGNNRSTNGSGKIYRDGIGFNNEWKAIGTTIRGLETFAIYSTITFQKQGILALIQNHSETLTALDLSYTRYLGIQVFVLLLSNLPRLQFLSIALSTRINGEESTAVEGALRTPWTALSIKCLILAIDMGTIWTGSMGDGCIGYVFSQIGRLLDLEEWHLIGPKDLLTMRRRYLGHLSELKNLKSLNFSCSEDIDIDLTDAEWMLQNWTRWTHLVMYERTYRKWTSQYRQSGLMEVLKKLVDSRPWMRICGHVPGKPRDWPLRTTLNNCSCYGLN